jgi:hypothetical protein
MDASLPFSPLAQFSFSHALRTPSNTLVRTDLGFRKRNFEAGGEGGRPERGDKPTLAALTPLLSFRYLLDLPYLLVKTLASGPTLLLLKFDLIFFVTCWTAKGSFFFVCVVACLLNRLCVLMCA